MSKKSLFFPILKRRPQYRTKANGDYYADYKEYKQEVREDCLGRCVYCDSHENELGGPTSMNLDHFRPQKYAQFQNLVNDPPVRLRTASSALGLSHLQSRKMGSLACSWYGWNGCGK